MGQEFTMKKSDGGDFTMRNSDEVRVHHERKSDGVRVRHQKEQWGESSP